MRSSNKKRKSAYTIIKIVCTYISTYDRKPTNERKTQSIVQKLQTSTIEDVDRKFKNIDI